MRDNPDADMVWAIAPPRCCPLHLADGKHLPWRLRANSPYRGKLSTSRLPRSTPRVIPSATRFVGSIHTPSVGITPLNRLSSRSRGSSLVICLAFVCVANLYWSTAQKYLVIADNTLALGLDLAWRFALVLEVEYSRLTAGNKKKKSQPPKAGGAPTPPAILAVALRR